MSPFPPVNERALMREVLTVGAMLASAFVFFLLAGSV